MEALSWGGDGPKGSANATCVAVWPQDLAVAMEKVQGTGESGKCITWALMTVLYPFGH